MSASTNQLEVLYIDHAIVVLDYLSLRAATIDEMVDVDQVLIPDAPEANPHGHRPTPLLPFEPLGPEDDPSNDDDNAVPSS